MIYSLAGQMGHVAGTNSLLDLYPQCFQANISWRCPSAMLLYPCLIGLCSPWAGTLLQVTFTGSSKQCLPCACFKRLTDFSPGWCGSVDWVQACEPKGHWFNSQSGHMPGFWPRSLVGGTWEATTHWCFYSSLSPSLPLSLKINK